MKWQGREGSSNIEDRRGMGLGLPIGGGIGGVILLLLFSALTGQNPIDVIESTVPDSQTEGTNGVNADDPATKFVSVVLADTEDTWTEVLRQHGVTYPKPTLVLFTDATQSACGLGQSAMGPFYCQQDQKVYLDLSFFHDLDARFGAPGDFAQAYVIAHEVGHHVQNVTGLLPQISQRRSYAGERESNALSVRQELQADCYAGIWGHYAAQRGLLEPGDAEEGLQAAAAIGDDRLQQQTQGRVVPESFTHGSSAERVRWLRRGLESGQLEACNTFGSGT
jgi:predicted metalloprotease